MVYFVGAGPGAPDLITVRGQELLKRADIIIYAGSLVNAQLLKAAPACCLIYNSAVMTLEGRKNHRPPAHRGSQPVWSHPGTDGSA